MGARHQFGGAGPARAPHPSPDETLGRFRIWGLSAAPVFIVVLSHYMNARTEQAILTESVFLAS